MPLTASETHRRHSITITIVSINIQNLYLKRKYHASCKTDKYNASLVGNVLFAIAALLLQNWMAILANRHWHNSNGSSPFAEKELNSIVIDVICLCACLCIFMLFSKSTKNILKWRVSERDRKGHERETQSWDKDKVHYKKSTNAIWQWDGLWEKSAATGQLTMCWQMCFLLQIG